MLNVVYNTIMHFINTIFLFYVIKTITKKDYSRKEKWSFIIISGLTISLLYNTVYKVIEIITLKTLISTVLYIVLSRITLKNKIYQSIIGVGIVYILTGIGEAISYLIFVQKMGLTAEYITNNIGINIILHVISYSILLLFLAIPVIRQSIKNNKDSSRNAFPNYKRQAVIIMAITLFIIAFGIYGWYEDLLTGKTLVIMNVLLTLIFLVASTVYILTLQKVLKENQENEELKTYIQLTQELSEELRRFKHNYRNLLYGLGGYIENKKWDKLKAYYDDLLHESFEASTSDIYSMRNIKNNALFGLIAQKVKFIKELNKNIGIQINVPHEIENLYMKECDICEVVGAHLDNAIEAASKAIDRRIIFEMFEDEGNLNIIIKNTFLNQPDLSRIFDKGYSTKQEQGKGLGLYFVKNILNRYRNVLYNTYINDDLFVQEIIIQEKIL